MWVGEVEIHRDNSILGKTAKKYGVSFSVYPVSFHSVDNFTYIYLAGFVRGPEENIEQFIEHIKDEKRIVNFEKNKNFIVAEIKDTGSFKPGFFHRIFCSKPVIIDTEGTELWTVAGWEKDDLLRFINIYEKTYGARLIKLFQENFSNISVLCLHPELTLQQKRAMELAISRGYYDYPRKTELEKLAEVMGVSYSTYHAHLRKAEQKVFPFLFEKARRIDSENYL
jgi:predicted DNA binding protein